MVAGTETVDYALIVLAASGAVDEKEKLIFEPYDNGMAWPLLDFGDITLSLTHGVHCIDVMRYNDSSRLHQLHKAHCIDLARKIQDFFESTPNYTVPEILCKDIRSIAFPGGRLRRGLWKTTWRGGRKKRAIPQLIKPRRGVVNRQQDDRYSTMAAQNFEEILIRRQEGQPLTRNEIDYLLEAESGPFIHMAALGLYCKYEGYISVVRDMFNDNLLEGGM